GVMMSRTVSWLGSSTASSAASRTTCSAVFAARRASTVSGAESARANAPTTWRYSAASRSGATMKITMRAARLGSFPHRTGLCDRRHFFRRRAGRARNNRPGVAHATSRRGGLARNEADHGLGHPLLYELRGLLFVGAADLADHDHGIGRRVGLEGRQAVDEV